MLHALVVVVVVMVGEGGGADYGREMDVCVVWEEDEGTRGLTGNILEVCIVSN